MKKMEMNALRRVEAGGSYDFTPCFDWDNKRFGFSLVTKLFEGDLLVNTQLQFLENVPFYMNGKKLFDGTDVQFNYTILWGSVYASKNCNFSDVWRNIFGGPSD